MTSATSTHDAPLRQGPSIRRRGLVVAGFGVPDWVAGWCARRGREVCARPHGGDTVASLVDDSVLVPQNHHLSAERPRIVAAVGALPDDDAVLDEAAEAAAELRGSLVVLHGVPLSFGERTIGLPEAMRHGQRLLDQGRARAREVEPGVVVEIALVRAWPHELIGERLDADLLVLGGARTATPTRLGRVATTAVQHAPCVVILTPRPSSPPLGAPAERAGIGSG